jgi:hypothetical protein
MLNHPLIELYAELTVQVMQHCHITSKQTHKRKNAYTTYSKCNNTYIIPSVCIYVLHITHIPTISLNSIKQLALPRGERRGCFTNITLIYFNSQNSQF